ncbi:MAG: hypothetical protein JWL77_6206 [Chthonomonadaceae bacterium]|nr:hypothetical protein [Chthonomonadaceae bacterium]
MKTPICLTVSTLLLATMLMTSDAQAQLADVSRQGETVPASTPVVPTPSAHKVVIRELTEVPVILKGDVQSDGNQVGTELLFYVTKDIYGPGHTLLIARDTPVPGQIVEAPANLKSRRADKLALRCDYILAWDKTRIPLRGARKVARSNAQTGQASLTGLSNGGVIVDTLANDKDARLPVGKTYRVYVNADTPTEALAPNIEQDARFGTTLREGFALLKDGSWAIGLIRQVGKNYILTNSGGSQSVRISDVRSLEFLQDAGSPYGKYAPAAPVEK